MSIADKLTTIAENEQKVYDAGKKAEYDTFWDEFQDNGNRTNYLYGFAGYGWNDTTFKPKYDIRPTAGAQNMFARCQIGNMKSILEEQGVTLDLSQESGSLGNAFYATALTHLPTISTISSSTLTNLLNASSYLQEVGLVLKDDGSQTISGIFDYCSALKEIDVSGTFGNTFSARWSTQLSKASITSIINALSTTTSGLTVTLSKTAKENAFTNEEWATLIATKSNWTISLL